MSGYEPCGLGVCAANAGHEEPCAVASGWADEEELWVEVARLRDQRDSLAARLATVEALADEWETELDSGAIASRDARFCWQIAVREVRAALATGATTSHQEGE